MSKARKLPSGSWNVQVYEGKDANGKKLWTSFTAASKDEAEFLAAEYKTGRAKKKAPPSELSVGDAVDRYIELSGVLSPSTLHAYQRVRAHAFPQLMSEPVENLTPELVQMAVNEEAHRPGLQTGRPLSAKTIKNEWALVAAALKEVCNLSFNVKLPRIQQHVKELPAPEVVLRAVLGSDVELPCLLAMWLSLSMSEIRGLMCSSVHDGAVFVRQVAVDVGAETVIKPNAKTGTRLRKLALPPYLERLINSSEPYQKYAQTGADGPLVPLNRSQIYGRWKKLCRDYGMQMSFHDLRHLNASIMLMLGVPEKYAMERGGWSTPHVMKSVYQHTFTQERQRVDAKINAWFERFLNKTPASLDFTQGPVGSSPMLSAKEPPEE